MSLSADMNNQISSALSEVESNGGDTAVAVVAELLAGIAQSLASAKKGNATMDDLSTSIENAEASLHEIIAELVNS
jgi:F0F1-type ATP synthase membrane subunit b/b'